MAQNNWVIYHLTNRTPKRKRFYFTQEVWIIYPYIGAPPKRKVDIFRPSEGSYLSSWVRQEVTSGRSFYTP